MNRFLRKKIYHSFYYWNVKRALLVGAISLIATQIIAFVIVWVLAIALDIGYAIMGQTPDQAAWVTVDTVDTQYSRQEVPDTIKFL